MESRTGSVELLLKPGVSINIVVLVVFPGISSVVFKKNCLLHQLESETMKYIINDKFKRQSSQSQKDSEGF